MHLRNTILISFLAIVCVHSSMSQNLTWSDDIACIIYNNCAKCHHPGGAAPSSFLTYQEVFQKRASIRIYVLDGLMPPSPAEPGDIPFRNDLRLTDEEIQMISDWVLQGAPAGDLGIAPPPPTIPDQIEIPDPDGVLQIPTYTSTAMFNDDYRCFAFETDFGEDKWVTGIEIIPGNKSIVHHVILYEDANDEVLLLDAADPLPGYQCFGGVGSFSANFAGGWVPGQAAQFLPEGTGLLIPQNTNLIIQTHYPSGSFGMQDSTRVHLQFAPGGTPLRQVRVTPYINHFTSLVNGPLFIPANTMRTFRAEQTVVANVSLLSVLPHMHLIGTSMHCYAVLPITNDTIRLFDIHHWDFHWQHAYHFRSPVHLPFGTKLVAEATYDNTSNNPHNPSFPPQDVSAGEATTDEMFLIFFSYLIYQPGDENMVFEDDPPFSEACAGSVSSVDLRPSPVRIAPNPANKRVTIQAPWLDYQVALHDAFGRLILTAQQITELPTGGLADGMYYLVIQSGRERYVEKLVIVH